MSELFSSVVERCQGPAARYVHALLAVDVQPQPDRVLTVIPHGYFLVSLQFAAGAEPFARDVPRGWMLQGCGMREAPHSYRPQGGCRSLFALLTPAGAVALRQGNEGGTAALPRQPLAHWLPPQRLAALEGEIAGADDARAQLRVLGHWLEDHLAGRTRVPWQAWRAARIAAHLFASPQPAMGEVVAAEGISLRQLQRDFKTWLGASPKHASLVARVQAVARFGAAHPLADVAHRVGFADQSHMSRVVKRLTSVTPQALVRSATRELGAAFRGATGGELVYL